MAWEKEKAAFAAGKRIQWRAKPGGAFAPGEWSPTNGSNNVARPIWASACEYRIFPGDDVPAGPTWFTVWGGPNGQSGPPRVKHDTFEKADTEAKRLATLHPGREFYVMQPVASAKGVATTTVTLESNNWRKS